MHAIGSLFSAARYAVFGVPFIHCVEKLAMIRSAGFDSPTTDELDVALKYSENCPELNLAYCFCAYGTIHGNTSGHEGVICRNLRDRTKPLETLYLNQIEISEAGMKVLIESLEQNFARLGLKKFIITRDSVLGATKEALTQFKQKHPEVKVIIREFGTARAPRDGSGYNEELSC
jgi:hypothetical protein